MSGKSSDPVCLLVLLFASVALLVSVANAVEVDLTIEIAPGARECFYQHITRNHDVEVEYQVIDGGDLDVDFVVQSPGGKYVVDEKRKMESVHSFDSEENGDYQFCIDNTFSRFSSKVVFFELIVDSNDEPDTDYGATVDEDVYEVKLEDFRGALDKVMERLRKSSSIQNILRVIESRDRSMQENNFERVNLWSGIQIFVMVSVALTHVLMIRGLFQEKSQSRQTKMTT